MNLTKLTALSSIDGRYAGRTDALRGYYSEFGLIRHRILVEIRWFETLAAHPDLKEIPSLSEDEKVFLAKLITYFDEHEAEIKQRLHAAGTALSEKLPTSTMDKLLVLIPDAHSPKNQYLVEGAQSVFGRQFPMTGGSANKNAGQTFVYFRGRMYQDSAVALMLSGDFQLTMSGRLAKEKDAVIQTAEDGAREAMKKMKKDPIAVLAYNCAGRRSKLVEMEEELKAIQKAIGPDVPLFGCYNAGEIGPLDASERKPDALCGGSGWHVIFTVIGR